MSVIQQNLEKLTVVAGVATAAVTSTATSSAIDLLEYDGDVVLIWIVLLVAVLLQH